MTSRSMASGILLRIFSRRHLIRRVRTMFGAIKPAAGNANIQNVRFKGMQEPVATASFGPENRTRALPFILRAGACDVAPERIPMNALERAVRLLGTLQPHTSMPPKHRLDQHRH